MLWPTDTFREIDRMRRVMDQFFSRFPYSGRSEYQFPFVNLYEKDNEYIVVAEIPGVKKDDIVLNFQENILSVSGKRDIGGYGKSTVIRQEQPYGEFEKMVKLPRNVKSGEIKARLEDGILTISLPKSEEVKPKQIKFE